MSRKKLRQDKDGSGSGPRVTAAPRTTGTSAKRSPARPVKLASVRVNGPGRSSSGRHEILVEQERVHSIGELAFGIAHDVNNILAALRLRLGILIKDPACAASQSGNLEAMDRITREGSLLVSKLQNIGRCREPRIGSVDLQETIRAAVEIAQSGLSLSAVESGVQIRIGCHIDLVPKVRGYDEDLRHVFVNLLINARDAMPNGGTILIQARRQQGRVVVRVEDQGPGIPPEHLTKIFDPFFTTKGEHGTGMGLAMAKNVMKRLGSSIVARNRPGGGACFELRFQPMEDEVPECKGTPFVASDETTQRRSQR